jgi:hypothetical protein
MSGDNSHRKKLTEEFHNVALKKDEFKKQINYFLFPNNRKQPKTFLPCLLEQISELCNTNRSPRVSKGGIVTYEFRPC